MQTFGTVVDEAVRGPIGHFDSDLLVHVFERRAFGHVDPRIGVFTEYGYSFHCVVVLGANLAKKLEMRKPLGRIVGAECKKYFCRLADLLSAAMFFLVVEI